MALGGGSWIQISALLLHFQKVDRFAGFLQGFQKPQQVAQILVREVFPDHVMMIFKDTPQGLGPTVMKPVRSL